MRKRQFNAAMLAAISWPLVTARPRAGSAGNEASVELPPLLLAQKAPDKFDPMRYLVSEKYDGVRAYWNGHAMLTRHCQPIAVPTPFKAHLPNSPLDGELWIARGRFEAVSAAVRRHEPDETEWAQIKYMVYEIPGGSGSFEERYIRLRALAAESDWLNLQAAMQTHVADERQLAALLAAIVRGGGEGLVLHEASAPYLMGRSDALLKLKPQDDNEAVVLARVPGAGAMQGTRRVPRAQRRRPGVQDRRRLQRRLATQPARGRLPDQLSLLRADEQRPAQIRQLLAPAGVVNSRWFRVFCVAESRYTCDSQRSVPPILQETLMQQAKPPADSPGTDDPVQQTQMRMQALLMRSPASVCFVRDGRFQVVSEPFNHLFGHGDDTDLAGKDIRSVQVSDLAHTGLAERMTVAFTAGRPVDEEVEYVRSDGSRFWGRLQATPLDWNAPSGESLWILDDVTAARQARLLPTWTAKHDALTELANRREFERRLSTHVGSRRHEPVSVLWLDVDKFGEVTRAMGTEVADHFLYGLGQMLITKVRASDLVARLDSDHFAILLPDCDLHYAQIVAEKLRASVAGYRLRWGLHRTRVKACLGVVQLHDTLETVEAVLGACALACTEAKAAGGDSVRVFVSSGGYEELAG